MKLKEKNNLLRLNLQYFGGIKNLDRQQQAQNDLRQTIANAIESGDTDGFANALTEMANGIQEEIIAEAQSLINSEATDQRVLAERGVRVLTSKETKFYNQVIDNEGFAGVQELVPPTVIDRVFEELVGSHELLKAINFVNTTGVTKWITKKGNVNPAFWGKLTDAIKKKIDEGFQVLNTELYKLSAYIPVAKAMLDLGPYWLDKYVRTVLVEASALGMEEAVVKGTGKDQPIGMIKDLEGSVVEGVYPDKAAKKLTDLSPKTLGKDVMFPLTHDGKRTVNNVILVVNPSDYWSKVFPATTFLTQNGTYVYNVLPIPATIIQSVFVPTGKMIAGMAKDYFLGVGSSQKIEASDEVKFIEDERVYMTKQYANGLPLNNDAFQVFDISDIGSEPTTP